MEALKVKEIMKRETPEVKTTKIEPACVMELAKTQCGRSPKMPGRLFALGKVILSMFLKLMSIWTH